MAHPPPGRHRADDPLRDDIRRLGAQLGDVLRRQEGEAFLALVEDVRAAAKAVRAGTAPPGDLRRLLDPVDRPTAIRLARAFSSYFHLANLAEQVHREAGRVTAGPPGLPFVPPPISAPVESLDAAGAIEALDVRPVFTAHPTEASRRTVTDKRRQVADLLVTRGDPRLGDRDRERIDRHVGEVIELLWQTDELRLQRPTPVDEASSVLAVLDSLVPIVTGVLERFAERVEAAGREAPPTLRPLRFGTWVGGDRDGNPHVTAEVTREVLARHRRHGIAHARRGVDVLARELSISSRIADCSDELRALLARDAAELPEVHRRMGLLNAQEPYRLALAGMAARLRAAAAGEDGPVAYRTSSEVVDDLLVLRRSLLANRGEVIARGPLDRVLRTVVAFGFTMATMDVREDAGVHHELVGALLDRGEPDDDATGEGGTGPGRPPYRSLGREERTSRLASLLEEG